MSVSSEDEFAYALRDYLKPKIFEKISQFNVHFGQGDGIVAVITGGSALDEMLTNKIFRTDDFDVKLVFLEDEADPSRWTKEMYGKIENARRQFSDYMDDFLNKLKLDEPYKGMLLNDKNKRFLLRRGSFLASITYRHKIAGGYVTQPLFDIIGFTPKTGYGEDIEKLDKNINFGITDLERFDPNALYSEKDTYGAVSRRGFVNTTINKRVIVEIQPNIYCVSLGYLIWDTVRMINWSLDAMFQNTKVKLKLTRYIKKYMQILEALTNPVGNLKCVSPFLEYCNSCSNSGKKISNYDELKNKVKTLSEYYNSNQNSKAYSISSLTRDDVKKLISENERMKRDLNTLQKSLK